MMSQRHFLCAALTSLPRRAQDSTETRLAHERVPLPIFGYCVMPNHWHFVACPKTDTQVTDFFRWLTHTHTMRWHAHYHTEGTGHLYQGRFKTFPIQEDEHLVSVLRYVERNALQANLVKRAESRQGEGAQLEWHCR